MVRNRRIAVLGVSAAVFVGACGGTEDETSAQHPAGEAEYVAQTNRVCEQYASELMPNIQGLAAKYQARGMTAEDLQARTPLAQRFEDDIRAVLERMADMVRDLRAVPPPKALAGEVRVILDEYDSVVDKFVADPRRVTDPLIPKSIDAVERAAGLRLCPDVFGESE